MPPWGGQGANSGIADVHNLIWKIAYVAKGIASPNLLQSYQIERHPIDFLCADESAAAGDQYGLIDLSQLRGIATTKTKTKKLTEIYETKKN
jgi:putative polyketide hydroxylase